ncbi:MAG: hypothetical protein ACLFO2_01380 [Candidatus Woesearchaeota archaeon]
MALAELVKKIFSRQESSARLANNHAEDLARSNMRLSVYESEKADPRLFFWRPRGSQGKVVVTPDPSTKLRYYICDEPAEDGYKVGRISGEGRDTYSFTIRNTRYELHLSPQAMPMPEGARIQDVPVRTYLERHDNLANHPHAASIEMKDGHDAAVEYINRQQARMARKHKSRRSR